MEQYKHEHHKIHMKSQKPKFNYVFGRNFSDISNCYEKWK